MTEIRRPIFIIGTGRCGSTALHRILSWHPELAWLSHWCAHAPDRPSVNRTAMRLIDVPLSQGVLRRHIRPSECYAFWDHQYRGFSSPCRDLVAGDVPPETKRAVHESMAAMLTPRRHRLLIKITGWPRIGFLKEIFPDAGFIHMVRDGRAVAASLMGKPWWTGWGGPSSWKWGPLTAEQQTRWEATGRSFTALAGIQWEILMAAFDRAAEPLAPGDLLEIRYEDLCRSKETVLREAVDFAGIQWSEEFERHVGRFPFVNNDHKWSQQLSEPQQRHLEAVLRDTLPRYGYGSVPLQAPLVAAGAHG